MKGQIIVTILTIVVIIIGVYFSWGHIVLPDLFTQLVAGVLLLAPFIAIWGFKPILERIQGNSRSSEEYKNHTVDIMNIYKRLCEAGIRENRHGHQIVLPKEYKEFRSLESKIIDLEFKQPEHWEVNYVSLEYLHHYKDYDYFEDALTHLEDKSYKETYAHWTKVKTLLDEFNHRPKFEDKILEEIESKMNELFTDFKKGYGENIESYYEPYVIRDVIINLWSVDRVRFDFLKIHDKYGRPSIISEFGTHPQLSSSDKNKLDLEKYKRLLESLVTNESLKQMLSDETKAFQEIIEEMESFQKKLSMLIKNHKHKIIKGRCDSCP